MAHTKQRRNTCLSFPVIMLIVLIFYQVFNLYGIQLMFLKMTKAVGASG